MANSLIERFQLKESKEINDRYRRVTGSTTIIGREDEKHLKSMTVFECEGKKGEYKALKVVFDFDGKLYEFTPWPTLDYASTQRCEHMQSVEPKFVTFFQQIDTQTGETFNKVHIVDESDENEVKRAEKIWEERE